LDAIIVKELTKTYVGGKTALNKLSLSVKEGEIYTLLGPNGAGKSTLINTLTTYLKPTSGLVQIMGKDLSKEQKFVRSQIACVAQKASIDNHLTLRENMLFQSRLYKLDKATAKSRMQALIHAFGLKDYVDSRVSTYSGGVKRRLDIAMSMMSYPKILYLDEPTVGMDIESRKAMWDIIKKIQNDYGTTVFLTTHYLEEADMLSDTICIIKDGHEIVQDSPENLRRYTQQNLIKISLSSVKKANEFAEAIKIMPFVRGIRLSEQTVFINAEENERDFLAVNRFVLDRSFSFDSIEIVKPSLDDVFITIIQNEERGN
jgi:ABC-2 type transport system ATP-binding protein